MDTRRQEAFKFASDLAKQLITLSTGILAITITFSKDIIKPVSVPRYAAILLFIAWGTYLFCVVCGIWTLMALTGELEPKVSNGQPLPEPTTKRTNVFLPTVLQIVSFLIATGLIIAFGISSI
jgi:hypothetical protein